MLGGYPAEDPETIADPIAAFIRFVEDRWNATTKAEDVYLVLLILNVYRECCCTYWLLIKVTYTQPGASSLLVCFREDSGSGARQHAPPTPRSRLFAARKQANEKRVTFKNVAAKVMMPTMFLASWALRHSGAALHVVPVSDGSVRAVLARTREVAEYREPVEIIRKLSGPWKAKMEKNKVVGYTAEERRALDE